MKQVLTRFYESTLIILSFIFPFIEVSYYFGAKVFLSTDSITLKYIYMNYIVKLTAFYEGNIYLIFAAMIGIFITCSRGTVPLTKFVRFNIIQAILLSIICTCVGSIFSFVPLVLRESGVGILFANSLFLGIILVMLYSWTLVVFGRYPKLPVISEAARLQVQRGYLD
jgi:uncharacterized membrane protein|tara:strand:- start:480 stop:983 length:504 start_codon:yes stop_codon:yes gene_type:complete